MTVPGMGGIPPAPPGYAPPGLPDTAAGSVNIFRGRLVIVFGPSATVSGIFVYRSGTTPGPGNPPIFWATSGTVDPFGNALPSTVGVAGTGTFQAGDTIISPAGIFVYNGTPAAGNLIISIAPAAGTDPVSGQNFPAGIQLFGNTAFQSNSGNNTAVLSAGSLQFFFILAQLLLLNNQGLFLYAAPGGLGNLIASLATAAGTDTPGNPYPQGLFAQQLTLANVSATPPAFAGASVYFTTDQGRPAFRAGSGSIMILERSTVSTTPIFQGNSTLANVMSGIFAYLANEAVVNSEYEIEIFGLVTAPSTIANVTTLDWRLYIDGVNSAAGFTIGATVFSSTNTNSQPFTFTLRYTVSVQSTGVGGTVHIHSDGSIAATANKTVSDGADLGGDADAVPFDTTVNHNLQIRAFFGASPAGQGATTYRTKLTRRN